MQNDQGLNSEVAGMMRSVLACVWGLAWVCVAGSPWMAQPVRLEPLASYAAGVFDQSAAEIVVYESETSRVFVVNGSLPGVDVLSLDTSGRLSKDCTLRLCEIDVRFGGVNSVAVANGLLAVAVQHRDKTEPGFVVLLDSQALSHRRTLTVGALPDAIVFTPDGQRLVVANEGEPSVDGGVDPEGSVSVIDLADGVSEAVVRNAGFSAYNAMLSARISPRLGVRIHPNAVSPAADLEPEYIAVAPDGQTAWVSLQENNALAVVDLETAKVTAIHALGAKDHRLMRNGLDARQGDARGFVHQEPIYSLLMPDTIAAYTANNGQTYIVTANEGDRRKADDVGDRLADLSSLADLPLDPAFAGMTTQQLTAWRDPDTGLGSLEVSRHGGDLDGDGDHDEVYALGGRSFSIYNQTGRRVFDSGDDFERITATRRGVVFNATNDANQSGDGRSDNAGPEPEGLAVGRIGDRVLAFIGLERVGGVMVYDVSDPNDVRFKTYVNPRDFSIPDDELESRVKAAAGPIADAPGALDLGPEGLLYISAAQSPTGHPLLIVTNEVSGTTTVYAVR